MKSIQATGLGILLIWAKWTTIDEITTGSSSPWMFVLLVVGGILMSGGSD